MKNIGEGCWSYNGCNVYLAEHPKLQGKYEIYKGCDFISRAHNLKEAQEIIIEKFGKIIGVNKLKQSKMATYKATPNHSKKTFTIRTSNGLKYRTDKLSREEFEQLENATSNDIGYWLKSNQSYKTL